jgi:2-oxoglutarate ferredoxin oxidoreductase subunit gamma
MAEEAGNNRAANTAMLGLWTAMLGVLSREAMRQAVAESVPPKTVDLNLSVFDDGYQRGLNLFEEEKARG